MEMINRLFMFFLLNAIWQITLIFIVSLVCDWMLQKVSARIRHILWVAVLIFSFSLPLLNCVEFYRQNYLHKSSIQSEINALSPLNADVAIVKIADLAQPTKPLIPINKNLSLILLTLYLLFIGYRIIKFFKAWQQTRKIRQSAFSASHNEIVSSSINKCRKILGLKRGEVLYSSVIVSPMTAGAICPVVILPEKFLAETEQNVVLSAIGHEFIHIRRNDYLLNLIYEIIHLPLAFHPAATLVKRRIVETRESSCDEQVIGKLLEPAVYARSLVHLADLAMNLGRHSTISIGILDADVLEKRIMNILKRSKITANRRNMLLSFASLAFILSVVAAISFTLIPVVAQQTSTQESEAKIKAEKEVQRQFVIKADKEEQNQFVIKADKEEQSQPGNELVEKKRQLEVEFMKKQKAESVRLNRLQLIKNVKLSMAEALAVATNQQPGTVMEGRLVFEEVNGTDTAFYGFSIAYDNGTEKGEKFILVNANDGTLKNTENK